MGANDVRGWLAGTWAVFRKDIQLEMRDRFGISVLLMFVVSTLLLTMFAFGQERIAVHVQAALLWIVIVFAASIGLGRAFVSEVERGTVLLLQLHTRASTVYAGKLLFNFVLVLAANFLAGVAFVALLNIEVVHPGLFATTLLLGSLGLSGASTLLAAIIARTANRGPLLPVLVFPLLIPLLLSVVGATKNSLAGGGGWNESGEHLITLMSFAGVVISASVLLFDYVWKD